MDKKIITRFPPSPTGFLHIGRARTALFNFLFARQNEGKMVFRIEDTDKERSKREFEDNIVESLTLLGIKHDSGPYRQSERTVVYQKYLKKLIDDGFAYISKETPKEEGDREEVIRFKNPNKTLTFKDLIRGEITFDTTDLKDFVIAKSLEEPVYHLAVVVDDFEMGITHIIRGEDGISNTPRQLLIQQAIGAPQPVYAHVPLILAPDKSKLSGRHGAISVTDYREMGYLPEALVNYLALLGWNPGTEQEIFSMDELIELFDISKIQKSGAVFNIEKLNWINRQYLEKLNDADFILHAKNFIQEEILIKILPLVREKISFFKEISSLLDGELSFIKPLPTYDKESLKWKQEKDLSATKENLKLIIDIVSKISDFSKESVKASVWPLAEAKGKGYVLWPMRYALSGKDKSPDPFIISEILGREETVKRLTFAYESI